jgi:simple sugar transport system ATP-binding protein
MNLSIKSYRVPPLSSGPVVSRRAIDQRANELVKSFDIRGARPGLPVSLLSGGNLQRAILAREISERPKALVAAAPTRGLDVAATEAIRSLLLEERDKGSAILMISEDLEEVLALSDEIVVLYEGSVIGRLMPHEADPETIGLMMAGRQVELP